MRFSVCSCWLYGGRKTGEPGEKPSKHERDQLQQLYSHEFQVFWESTRGYTQVVTHPAITPSDRAYNLEFSDERQRANRICHPCFLAGILLMQILYNKRWNSNQIYTERLAYCCRNTETRSNSNVSLSEEVLSGPSLVKSAISELLRRLGSDKVAFASWGYFRKLPEKQSHDVNLSISTSLSPGLYSAIPEWLTRARNVSPQIYCIIVHQPFICSSVG